MFFWQSPIIRMVDILPVKVKKDNNAYKYKNSFGKLKIHLAVHFTEVKTHLWKYIMKYFCLFSYIEFLKLLLYFHQGVLVMNSLSFSLFLKAWQRKILLCCALKCYFNSECSSFWFMRSTRFWPIFHFLSSIFLYNI